MRDDLMTASATAQGVVTLNPSLFFFFWKLMVHYPHVPSRASVEAVKLARYLQGAVTGEEIIK